MNTIKEARKAAGLSQREVAKAMMITTESYRYRENSPYALTIGQTEKLAEVLGIPFEQMWNLVRRQISDNVGGGFNA